MENVRGISTFLRIVDTGNFSTAARDLGITPQAASMHVKQLETWVGVRLFNRSTRKVSLTEEGARFYETCKVAIGAIDDEVERLRDTTDEASGTVHVAAPYGIGSHFVAPALGRFLDMNPRVSVELTIQNRIPDVVMEGIDVGILPHPLPNASLVARRIVSSPFILCASPLYLRRNGNPQAIEELGRHRCIDLRSWITGNIRPWNFKSGDQIVSRAGPGCMVTNDAESSVEACLSGAGIAMAAMYRTAPYIRSARLVQVMPGQLLGSLDYSVYTQQRTHMPKKTRALVDFLYRELGLHPDLQLR